MDGRHCVGRFVPDMDQRSDEADAKIERCDEQRKRCVAHSFSRERDFTRGQQLVDTEINVQLGSLTLKTSR